MRPLLSLASALLIAFPALASAQLASSAQPESSTARPLLLEKNEGEHRVRRALADNTGKAAPSDFILKASPKDNGSQRLVAGIEDVQPGHRISKHRHLDQDEILFISTGTAHVWLGDQERDLHAGGFVFIPANTWISVQNTGTGAMQLFFVFSAPGFEDYLRCTSVPAGEDPAAMTADQRRQCAHTGHVVYEVLEAPQKK